MDVTIETLWKRMDAEVDRIQPVFMAALGDFIDVLLAGCRKSGMRGRSASPHRCRTMS